MLLNQGRKRKYFDRSNFDIKISIVTSRALNTWEPFFIAKRRSIYIFYCSQTSTKEEKNEQSLNVYDFWHCAEK